MKKLEKLTLKELGERSNILSHYESSFLCGGENSADIQYWLKYGENVPDGCVYDPKTDTLSQAVPLPGPYDPDRMQYKVVEHCFMCEQAQNVTNNGPGSYGGFNAIIRLSHNFCHGSYIYYDTIFFNGSR